MTLSLSNPRARQRWVLLGVLVFVLGLAGAAMTLAVHGTPPGFFEIDGNAANAGPADGDDWDNLIGGPCDSSPTGSATATQVSCTPDAAPETAFQGGGSKDDNDISAWKWSNAPNGVAPGKDDIQNAYSALYLDASGNRFIYFGMDVLPSSGTRQVGFWFLQDPAFSVDPTDGTFNGLHVNNDVLIQSNFTQGGSLTNLSVFKWVNGALIPLSSTNPGASSACDLSDTVCVAVNTATVDASWRTGIQAGDFFEGGIKLDGAPINFPSTSCITSAVAETRSSAPFSARLKDFAVGDFNTCNGTLTLAKTVVNDDGGTNVARDFTLSAAGTSRSFNLAAGTSPTSLTGNTGAQVVTAGVQYTLSETGPSGYTPSAWTCTGTGTTQGTGADVNKVTVGFGGSGTCAITNNDNTPKLTLIKNVKNDNGGTNVATDWTLSASGSGGFTNAVLTAITTVATYDSSASTGQKTVTAGVTYTLSESATPTGYTASTAWICTGGTFTTPNQISLGLGADVTCSIANDDTKASPAGTTVQRWVLHDTLTITGIRAGATGTAASVTFRLYPNDQCSAITLIGSETDSTIAAGVATTSTGIAVTATGFYYWTAQYSGDGFNNGFTTACGAEITQIQAKDAGRDDLIIILP